MANMTGSRWSITFLVARACSESFSLVTDLMVMIPLPEIRT
jgi:hypothetical protein